MIASLLLLSKFVYEIAKRLIHDAYFRSLGILVLLVTLVGTLFFWLVEGQTFLQALAYAVSTLAMNSPYGVVGMGPVSTGGIVFNILYAFLGVGLFLIFVLETGKTMVQSYDEFTRKMAERRALKRGNNAVITDLNSAHSVPKAT
jgi:amino acid permease